MFCNAHDANNNYNNNNNYKNNINYSINNNQVREMRRKTLKFPDFLHICGKPMWKSCLLVVHSEVFIESSGFGNGRDIEIFICGVDAAQLLLAHAGGRKAQHAIADRG